MQWAWTPQARRQRQEAIDYIAQGNPRAALDQLDRIEQQIDTLLAHPELGRPGRTPGTMRFMPPELRSTDRDGDRAT